MKKRNVIDINDDLFEDSNDVVWSKKGDSIAVTTTVAAKKSNKKFFSELDSFFETAMDDVWNETPKKEKEESSSDYKEAPKGSKKSFFSGLDALFSSTATEIPSHTPANEGDTAYMKRVTFLFKKEKLEELKGMAKKEKLYLRDIISKVLDDYLANKQTAEEKN